MVPTEFRSLWSSTPSHQSPIDDSFGLSACERDFAAILSSMEGKLCDICSRPGTSKQCPGSMCLVFYLGILHINYLR